MGSAAVCALMTEGKGSMLRGGQVPLWRGKAQGGKDDLHKFGLRLAAALIDLLVAVASESHGGLKLHEPKPCFRTAVIEMYAFLYDVVSRIILSVTSPIAHKMDRETAEDFLQGFMAASAVGLNRHFEGIASSFDFDSETAVVLYDTVGKRAVEYAQLRGVEALEKRAALNVSEACDLDVVGYLMLLPVLIAAALATSDALHEYFAPAPSSSVDRIVQQIPVSYRTHLQRVLKEAVEGATPSEEGK